MESMNRRTFMGNIGIGTVGTAGALACPMASMQAGKTDLGRILPLSETREPLNHRSAKIKVKPVSSYVIHEGVWTGPCRWNPNPPPEEERKSFRAAFDESVVRLRQVICPDAEVLTPVYVEFSESGGFGERELSQLEADHEAVDLYYAGGNVYPQYAASLIGERYRKPVAMIGEYVPWDMSARLRSKGLEGYALSDLDEMNRLISLLRARKIFQGTNILIVSDTPFKNRPSPSACMDFHTLGERFGLKSTIIDYREMAAARENILRDPDRMQEANAFADTLIRNAEAVRIDRQWVVSSTIFYLTIKDLMRRYGCNAFTIECFEFCSRRTAYDWKVVPCLTHSLLKDEGFTSGCEGDINVTLAMDLLMGISRRAAYMGNLEKKDETSMYLGHNVPATKMLGFDAPALPYSLQNFITEGWGTKVQMNLANVGETKVTIARFDPLISKLLVIGGEITGCEGQNDAGCSLVAHVRVADPDSLVREARNYGFHFAMVYGDYVRELQELGEMLKIRIEAHHA